jgi:hypothetical protein
LHTDPSSRASAHDVSPRAARAMEINAPAASGVRIDAVAALRAFYFEGGKATRIHKHSRFNRLM